jgi:hypothetical protein
MGGIASTLLPSQRKRRRDDSSNNNINEANSNNVGHGSGAIAGAASNANSSSNGSGALTVNANNNNNNNNNNNVNNVIDDNDRKRSGPINDDVSNSNNVNGNSEQRAIKRVRHQPSTPSPLSSSSVIPQPHVHNTHNNAQHQHQQTLVAPIVLSASAASSSSSSTSTCHRCDQLTAELAAARRTIESLTHGTACAICLDLLIQPLAMSCGHTFCAMCLLKHLKRKGNNNNNGDNSHDSNHTSSDTHGSNMYDDHGNDEYDDDDGKDMNGNTTPRCPLCRVSVKEAPRVAPLIVRDAVDAAVTRLSSDELMERYARLPMDSNEAKVMGTDTSSSTTTTGSVTRDMHVNDIMAQLKLMWPSNARKPLVEHGISMCCWCGFELEDTSPSCTSCNGPIDWTDHKGMVYDMRHASCLHSVMLLS